LPFAAAVDKHRGMSQEPNTPHIDEQARETGAMEILDQEQCWSLLSSSEVGRLAVAAAGEIDIFPVNYVVDAHTLVFRSAEGTKLVEVVIAHRCAFEVDGYDPSRGQAWSVVAKGEAEVLNHMSDVDAARQLPLFPWNASPKERFVRITPRELTGRRFTVARRP
jgi:nitroimidazol reductase NimA-like FMN-containing flavoprotein (pyridoxamine 5'-phosphate oxidase superfamily)